MIWSIFEDQRTANGWLGDPAEKGVTDSVFTDNQAQAGLGGAIHSDGPLTIGNSEFLANSADRGGAIRTTGTTEITTSTFSENAASYGGALRVDGTMITVMDSLL